MRIKKNTMKEKTSSTREPCEALERVQARPATRPERTRLVGRVSYASAWSTKESHLVKTATLPAGVRTQKQIQVGKKYEAYFSLGYFHLLLRIAFRRLKTRSDRQAFDTTYTNKPWPPTLTGKGVPERPRSCRRGSTARSHFPSRRLGTPQGKELSPQPCT